MNALRLSPSSSETKPDPAGVRRVLTPRAVAEAAAAYNVDVAEVRRLAEWAVGDHPAGEGPALEDTGMLADRLREQLVGVLALLEVIYQAAPPAGLGELTDLARRALSLRGPAEEVGPFARRDRDVPDVPLGPVKRMRALAMVLQLLGTWLREEQKSACVVDRVKPLLDELSEVQEEEGAFNYLEILLLLLRVWHPDRCRNGHSGPATPISESWDADGAKHTTYLCVQCMRDFFDHQRASIAGARDRAYHPHLPVEVGVEPQHLNLAWQLALPWAYQGASAGDD